MRSLRRAADERSELRHRLEIQRTEAQAADRRVRDRLEAEWGRAFEELVEDLNRRVRHAMTEAEQELWADIQPEFAAIHELRSDLPVECITICVPSFAGNHWAMVLHDPGEWAVDIPADLAFHRAVLQSVQHGRPRRRWLLKTPGWLFLLDDLLAAYPDASVIVSHRDPARTMPSTVSTTAMTISISTMVKARWQRGDREGFIGEKSKNSGTRENGCRIQEVRSSRRSEVTREISGSRLLCRGVARCSDHRRDRSGPRPGRRP